VQKLFQLVVSGLKSKLKADGAIYMRIDKKRKFPAITLLRAMGYDTNDKDFEKMLSEVLKVWMLFLPRCIKCLFSKRHI
jgi:DNA-directed RNA polymerase beta subunit